MAKTLKELCDHLDTLVMPHPENFKQLTMADLKGPMKFAAANLWRMHQIEKRKAMHPQVPIELINWRARFDMDQ